MMRLRERWRRLSRLVRWPIVLLAALVGLRLALVPALPFVAGRIVAAYGWTVDWQRLSLTLRSGQLDLRGLSLAQRAEGDKAAAPWLTLERLHADLAIGDLFSGGLRLQRLELDGLVVRIERRADGSIPWLSAFAASPPPEPQPEPKEPAELRPLELSSPVRIDHLRGSQLVLQLEDALVPGGGERRLVLGMRGENIGYPERDGTLNIQASSPGILDELALELSEHSNASVAAAELALTLRGLHPTPLAGYLAPLGLAPDAEAIDGRAQIAFELAPAPGRPGALALDLELRDWTLARDGAQAFGLQSARLALTELGAESVRGLGLELAGLSVRARRNAAGELCLGGLRSIEAPAATPAPASAPAPQAHAPLRWSVAGLSLKGVEFELHDESPAGASQQLELESLELGAFDPESSSVKTPLELAARAQGSVRDFTLHGTFEREGDTCGAELSFAAQGLELARGVPLDLEGGGRMQFARAADGVWTGSGSSNPLLVGTKPGMQHAGFEGLRFDPAGPALSIASLELAGLNGSLLQPVLAPLGIEVDWKEARLQAGLEAALANGALSAHVRGLAFGDGEQRHASVDEIGIEGWKIAAGLRELGAIRVSGVACELARDEQGVLHAFGLRSIPKPATAAEPAVPQAAPPAEPSLPKLPELGCAGIDVEGLRLHWTDRAQGRALDTTLEGQMHCPAFAAGAPLPIRVDLRAQGLLESLALEARLSPAPARIALEGKLSARGLAPGFGGYLPPGLELRSASDALELGFQASAEPASESGVRAKFELSQFRWGAHDEPACLAFERATLDLPRLSAQAIEIGEISLRGLRGSAVKQADGSLVVGGLHLVEAAPAPAAPPPPAEEAPLDELEPTAPAAAPAPPPPLPQLSLGKLELELAGFELRDESAGAEAQPLVLEGSFATEGPLVLVDTAPEALPPLAFVLRASAAPLVPKIELRIALEQWLVQPHVELSLLATGLRGAALVEIDPRLAARIDGSGLEGGELEAHLSGSFDFARRGLGRFDLARPFSAELALDKLALRASPGGEVLAALERVEAVVDRIDLRTGSVRAKSIELTRPMLRAERTSEGLRLCGLLLRSAPAPAPASAPAPAPAPAPTPRAVSTPQPELSVARITVSGLDFQFQDSRVDPPLLLPLTDLEFELRGLTSRALTEQRSLAFEASLRAGLVKLPPHGSVRAESERDLFSACDFSGRVQLFPETSARFRLGLEDLQLVHFRSSTEPSGVRLEDGRLDLSVGGRYSTRHGLSLDSVAVLGELDISETENGPLQSALGLPMPLQATLALVRDLEGNVRIPMRISLESDSISRAELLEGVLTSISTILSRAILSSPFRVVGGLAGRVGLQGSANGAGPSEGLHLGFDEGSAQLEGLSEGTLRQLSGKLSADDRLRLVLDHSFSSADLARSRVLSNPDLDDCRELSQRLRLKKAELGRARAVAAAQVRVELAVGRTREALAGAERLREIDAELGRSEEALDHVHEFLAEGAPRKAAARLRGAARALANQRLERVRAALLGAGIDPASIVVKSGRIEPGEAAQGYVRLRLLREQ